MTNPDDKKSQEKRETPAVFGKVDSASEAIAAATMSGFGFKRVIATFRGWWRDDVIGAVDHNQVIDKRRDDCALSEHYLFMTAMSAGIAVIGLLQSSTAVVIGAMLLSPLMGPIMGLGFALSIGDYNWLKHSVRSLAWGSVMAIFLCALIVFLSPVQDLTPEIAARTRPTLFDLLVALFSGLAGAYAMIRGRAGAIVGVAIATALMPPLAVVGFGLATFNWTAFSGALLLYFTNLITIALTAFALARIYGFRTSLSARQTQFQNFAIIAVFVGLAIPLAFALQQIAWEATAQGVIRGEIEEAFEKDSAIDNLVVDFRAQPITVGASVFTSNLRNEADVEKDLSRSLQARLGREFDFNVTQIKVARDPSAAERAQLSAASEQEDINAANERAAQSLAIRLSLIAGVSEDEVTVDRQRRRATVRAKPLEGATLMAYRTLEERIAATEPNWAIELIPPLGDLPQEIGFDEDGPTPAGASALSTIEWASKRFELPIVLVGNAEDCSRAAEILGKRGVSATVRRGIGPLRAQWGVVGE